MGFFDDIGGKLVKVAGGVKDFVVDDVKDTAASVGRLVGPGDFKGSDAANLAGAALMFTPVGLGTSLAAKGAMAGGKQLVKHADDVADAIKVANKIKLDEATSAAAKAGSRYGKAAKARPNAVSTATKFDEAKDLKRTADALRKRGTDPNIVQKAVLKRERNLGSKIAGRGQKRIDKVAARSATNKAVRKGLRVGTGAVLHFGDDMPSIPGLFSPEARPNREEVPGHSAYQPGSPLYMFGGGLYGAGAGAGYGGLSPQQLDDAVAAYYANGGNVNGQYVYAQR